MIELMRELKGTGYRMAMLTNNVREWEPLWRSMLPVDEIFGTVVDSGFVGCRKPESRIYTLTLERLGAVGGAVPFRRRRAGQRRRRPESRDRRDPLPRQRPGNSRNSRDTRARKPSRSGDAGRPVRGAHFSVRDPIRPTEDPRCAGLQRPSSPSPLGPRRTARPPRRPAPSDAGGESMPRTSSRASSSVRPASTASSPRNPAASFSASRRFSPSEPKAPIRKSRLGSGWPISSEPCQAASIERSCSSSSESAFA